MPTVSRAWPRAGASRASPVRRTSANAGSAVQQQGHGPTVAGGAHDGCAELGCGVVEHRPGHLRQVRPSRELRHGDRQRRLPADPRLTQPHLRLGLAAGAPLDQADGLVGDVPAGPQPLVPAGAVERGDDRELADGVGDIGLPGRPDALDHDEPRGHPLAERRAHRERPSTARRCRRRGADDRRQPVGGEEGAGDPVQVLRRQRPRSADDRTAGGREDAAGQAGLRADEADQLVQAAALGDRLQQLALAVQRGGELRPAPGGDAADDELGEGREGHVLGHRQQRQVVAAAGLDHVRWHAVEHRLAGGEGHRSGGGAGRDEALRVLRGAAPHQAADDQLTAGEVAPGVGQVGGVDPAHRPVERPRVAVVQPQVELRRTEQLPQHHWRNVQPGPAIGPDFRSGGP